LPGEPALAGSIVVFFLHLF